MVRFVIRQRRILLAVLAVYWLAMMVGTHLPEPHIPHVFDMQDKLMHTVAYALLTMLVLLAWKSATTAFRPTWYFVLVACLAVHAAADELTQQLMAGRTADLIDWTADMLGVFLAIMLAEQVFRRFGWAQWFASSTSSADVAG